jgi:hypothetical protein
MTVDREARLALRDALVRYMTGEIKSFEFDDTVSPLADAKAPGDGGLRQIARALWMMYDDLIDHPISVLPEGWDALRRTLAFLQTDIDDVGGGRCPAWPFASEEEWRRNAHLLNGITLPPYDAAVHGRPANPWYNRIPSVVGFAVLLAVLVVVAFVLVVL